MNTDPHETAAGDIGPSEARLASDDAAAVDGWFDRRRPATDREHRVAALLDLLDTDLAASDALVDSTMLRIGRALQPAEANDPPPALTPLDAEALDAWLLASGRTDKLPAPLRVRAERHAGLADLVSAGATPDAPADLVDRVMASVEAAEVADDREPAIAGRIRLADLMSIAAVLLVGVSVIWPMLTSMREAHNRSVGSQRLATAAAGLHAYTGAYDSLPMASASLAGDPWWEVGENPAHSNSANLYTLASEGFVEVAHLASPTNPAAPTRSLDDAARDWRSMDEVSYSFSNLFGASGRPESVGPDAVLMADRSPIVPRSRRGEMALATANSLNYNGRGQHLLLGDGSVRWATSPVLENGDNIWLPGSAERDLRDDGRAVLRGTETADGPGDAFLVP